MSVVERGSAGATGVVAARPTGRGAPRRSTILKIVVTIALAGYVLWQARLGDALAELGDADWRYVLVATCFAVLAMVLNVSRWKLMLHGQGARAPLPSLVRLYLIGMFFNNILPSRLGGDVVRAYGASILATSKTRSVAAVLMDRLVGATSVLLLGVLALALNPTVFPWQLGEVLVFGLGITVVILAVLLSGGSRFAGVKRRLARLATVSIFGLRIGAKLSAGVDAVRSYARARGLIGRALIISMVANGLSIVNLYLYSSAVSADVSLAQVAVVAPVVLAVGLLPLSINGIGTIELTFVVLFGELGVPGHLALAIALLRRLVLLVLSLVGGVLYAVRRFA